MSTPLADDLREQQWITAYLESMTELANIETLAAYRGDSVIDLDMALSGLPQTGILGGAAIVVLQPEAEKGTESTSAIIFPRTHRVRVIEVRAINRQADGSMLCGLNAHNIRDYVIQGLHGRFMVRSTLMFAGYEPYRDVQEDGTPYGEGWEIKFTVKAALGTELRTPRPTITAVGTTVTIAGHGLSGEVLYYTTDSTGPQPGAAGTTVYSAPFTATSGATITAASRATGKALSDYIQLTV